MSQIFSTKPFSKEVPKPWGKEIIITPEKLERTGKFLMVNAGKRLSFQYHDEKEETLCLISGDALLWLENRNGEIQKIPMQLFKGYTIQKMQKHRVETLQDSVIIEVSSPEAGTTMRIEDDFSRTNETEELRAQPNRGWYE